MLSASSWKYDARRPSASGTRTHERREGAQAHGLQDLLRDDHFARAVAVRLRRQRDADRVADALLQQHGQRGRRRDDALQPMPASVSPRCSG